LTQEAAAAMDSRSGMGGTGAAAAGVGEAVIG
jgi:hypothetical protein